MTNQRKPKINPRDLIARLSKESNTLLQREIIAPLLPGGKIRTRLGGMVHEFKPTDEFTGWGRFRPLNEREAALVAEAMPWERGGYLELFPALRVVLLWPDSASSRAGMWWALPYNESDARQRFGFGAEPLPVFLCDPTNGAEGFERVIVRVDGRTLWFDGPDSLADPTHAEWLRDTCANINEMNNFLPGLAGSERLALIFWQIRQLEVTTNAERRGQPPLSAETERNADQQTERAQPTTARPQNRQQQRSWLQQEAARRHMEEHLRHALAKADAVLHSFSEIPGTEGSPSQLVVEWSEQGQRRRYRSTIDPRLTIVSSGICLSGRDNDFDLTSLVSVMSASPWRDE